MNAEERRSESLAANERESTRIMRKQAESRGIRANSRPVLILSAVFCVHLRLRQHRSRLGWPALGAQPGALFQQHDCGGVVQVVVSGPAGFLVDLVDLGHT